MVAAVDVIALLYQIIYFVDNLGFKIASESMNLVLLAVYSVKRHALSLDQSTSLILKYFSKTEANSVSQRKTR